MMKQARITTVDNPYNPFNEFELWYLFDIQKGYNTCSRLASITATSNQFSDAENADIEEDSMNELIKTGAIDKNGNIIEYIKIEKGT